MVKRLHNAHIALIFSVLGVLRNGMICIGFFPEVSLLISCDAVLVRSLWILAKFGRILTKNCSKIEGPPGTGILLRFKTASQLINELISRDVSDPKFQDVLSREKNGFDA